LIETHVQIWLRRLEQNASPSPHPLMSLVYFEYFCPTHESAACGSYNIMERIQVGRYLVSMTLFVMLYLTHGMSCAKNPKCHLWARRGSVPIKY